MHEPHEATVTQRGHTASRLGLTVSESQVGLKQHLPLMSDRELARHDKSKRKGRLCRHRPCHGHIVALCH